MSSAVRSLKRGIVRNRCLQNDRSLKNFQKAWYEANYPIIERKEDKDGNVTNIRARKKMAKKQRHFEPKALIEMLKLSARLRLNNEGKVMED